MTKNSIDLEIYYQFHFNDNFEKTEFDRNFEKSNVNFSLNNKNNHKYNCFSENNNKIVILNNKIPICVDFYDFKFEAIKSFLENKKNTLEIDIFIYDFKNKNLKLLFLNKIKIKDFCINEYDYFSFIDEITIAYRDNKVKNFLNLRICNFYVNPNILNNLNIKGVFFEVNFINGNSFDLQGKKLNFCFKEITMNNP